MVGEEHLFCVVNLGVKPLFSITVAFVCSTKGSVFWDAPRENWYEERSQWRGEDCPFLLPKGVTNTNSASKQVLLQHGY